MKIQKIQCCNLTSSINQTKCNYVNNSINNSTTSIDAINNKKKYQASFGMLTSSQLGIESKPIYYWSSKKLRILNRSESEMRDLAEYFHDCGKDFIDGVCREAHSWSKKNAEKASKKLFDAVQKLNKEKPSMRDAELKRLDSKAAERENLFQNESIW